MVIPTNAQPSNTIAPHYQAWKIETARVFVKVYTLLPVILEADVGVGKDTEVGNAKNDGVVFAACRAA